MINVPPVTPKPHHAFFYHFYNTQSAVRDTIATTTQSHSISKTFNFIIASRVDNGVEHLRGEQVADIIISSILTIEEITTPTQFNSAQPATCSPWRTPLSSPTLPPLSNLPTLSDVRLVANL